MSCVTYYLRIILAQRIGVFRLVLPLVLRVSLLRNVEGVHPAVPPQQWLVLYLSFPLYPSTTISVSVVCGKLEIDNNCLQEIITSQLESSGRRIYQLCYLNIFYHEILFKKICEM